jgi:NADPH:quinone reductase-like Zn-dependent oxidoreductase
MSRVVRFHQTGAPEVLKIEQREVGAPGASELRIKVEAIGLNRAEAAFRAGAYLEAPNLPSGIGYEASGIVEAVGADVSDFKVGDAICVIPAFSMNSYSVYADQTIVPAYACTHRPSGLDKVESASIWMQYLTAYGALIDIAKLGKGDFVIIPAASSSVGLAAIQIANYVGATPIATTRGQSKVAALKEAGAKHVITGDQDLVAEVMRITDGKGARVAFDPVGGPTVAKLADATAIGGTIFLYGALEPQITPLPLVSALNRAMTFRGYTLFEIVADPVRFAAGKKFVSEGLSKGALKPKVAKTFTLDQIVEAHTYLESNQQVGKVVVTA